MRLPAGITFIQRGWINSNHVLIDAEGGPVLVDTGHGAYVEETMAALRRAGADPAAIGLIVNTHCHWDHIGANAALKAVSGAATATSAATAKIFADNDRASLWVDYFAADPVLISVDMTWQDGDVVQLGAYAFEVISTPGHAPDSIALFQPAHRLLISADALHENDCGILNTAVHGDTILAEAQATVERLQACEARIALPGHGRIITDVAANLEMLAGRLASFKIYPEKMARHLVRRVTMTLVLMKQPVARETLVAFGLTRPWPFDYAAKAGFSDPEKMLHQILDSFIQRGLIREQQGQLTSLVPR